MQATDRPMDLGKDNINTLMLRFSAPCILSLLISSLYNIVDQIFIGNSSLSTLGNAATGVVFPVFIIAQAFAWCLGDGCASYLNICQGRRIEDKAHLAVGGSVTLSFLSGVLMMALIYPFKRPILTLFGASENTMAYAVEYLDIVLAMIPIFILCNMMNSAIRADGNPVWAMLSMLAGAIVNIILDPVFIFTLDMGMAGAAWATVIGQATTFVMSVVYFRSAKSFRLKKESFHPKREVMVDVVRLGVSTFITQLAIVIVAILCNVQLSKYGVLSKYGADIPIAIIGIQSKIFTVVIGLVVGIALGCQPIISFNMGAKNYGRVKELYFKIMTLTLSIGAVFTLIFQCFPDFVVGLFGVPSNVPNPEDYWEFGEKTLRIFLSLITISCLIKMNSIFFQAAGESVRAAVCSVMRDLVCFVPLVILLPLAFPSVESILYAAPISDLVAAVVAAWMSISFVKSLHTREKRGAAVKSLLLRFERFVLSERGRRVCLSLLLSFYLIILLWGIVFKCNIEGQLNIERNRAMSLWARFTMRIIPFQDIYLSIVGRSFWNTLAFFFNVICFIPLGLLLRFIVSRKNTVWLSLALSLCVEIFQLFSGFGGFDPTDLFLNALGAYIGARLFERYYPRIPRRTLNILLCAFVPPLAVSAIVVTVRTIILFPV